MTNILAISIFVIVAAACKFFMDSVAHYDRFRSWGKWFSRGAMVDAKYDFMKKHPKWGLGIRRSIVVNVFVMFLDVWHLSAMVANLNSGFIVAYFVVDPMYIAYVFLGISLLFLIPYSSKK